MNNKLLTTTIIVLCLMIWFFSRRYFRSSQISRIEGAGTMSSSVAATIGVFGMILGSVIFVGAAYIFYNYMKE